MNTLNSVQEASTPMQLEDILIETLISVDEIRQTLDALYDYALPNHYLAGGAITQCLWNQNLGRPALDKVKDFDVVYYASEALHTEQQHETAINEMVSHSIAVDVKNQCQLHLWYGKKFGNNIAPLSSV
ncbi:MAG: nucleotidyltransferase family protein, partial [Pseudomonadales bacterium]|nr:nucleotidyltransferase family protein [Pseudomonadales bacterium]